MGLRERGEAVLEHVQATPLGRSLARYQHFRGSRLAGAVTFYGFLSIFPLLVLAFAITLRFLGQDAVAQFEDTVEGYVPGIADDLALPELRSQAARLGMVGAATLLLTGLGWVDAQRASVRAMWGLPDRDENVVVRKLKDAVALFGLGVLVVVSFLSTSLVGGLAERAVGLVGVEDGTAFDVTGRLVGTVLALVTAFALMAYLIAGLPRIRIQWRVLVVGAAVGGLGFEAGKHLLVGYISNVASTSTYGAFGVPVALAVWIYVMARLIMAVAAWTAEVSGASMVQPRFAEAALRDHAATTARAQEPVALAAPPVSREEGGSGRGRGRIEGLLVGALLAVLLLRRRGS